MGKMGSGRKVFSTTSTDYRLLEEIGYGASATVYRAIYLPSNEVVAIKCLNLDRCNSNLAGNILLDSSRVVKLGDFGVSACMFDKGDRQRSRNTFVRTPCWMAPEVLQPGSGHDFNYRNS